VRPTSNGTRRKSKAGEKATIGIKEIAARLGISIGTVDRALHGRPGINAVTRTRVLQAAEKLGYRPNLAARMLRSQKKLTISVLLPAEIASFYDAVRSGIRSGAAPFQDSVELSFVNYPRLGEGEADAFESALDEVRSDGIIVAPGRPAELKPWIRLAAEAGTAVLCVTTDAQKTARVGAVTSDPWTSGAVAGELLCRFRRISGELAVFTGDLSTTDHVDKVEGFRQSALEYSPGASVTAVLETHDSPNEARERARRLLTQSPGLSGIYVATSNSLPVLEVLQESGKLGETPVVTTDLFPEMVAYIRNGGVLATIHQRPEAQGRRAVQELYRYLVDRADAPGIIKLTPHVVMQSNVDLFLGQAKESDNER
jgi:LacI family transcriptional regulator